MENRKNSLSSPSYGRIIFAIALVIACLTIWYAMAAFLLAFSAILLAVFFHTVSKGVHRVIHLPYLLSLLLVLLVIGGGLVALFWIATPLITKQLSQLFSELPEAFASLKKWLSTFVDLNFLTDKNIATDLLTRGTKLLSQATTIFSITAESITGFIVFILVGIYLAWAPQRYMEGFLYLFPPKQRGSAAGVLHRLGTTLWWWILGKIISMVVVGFLSTIGLWILGIPLAFILGFLAGLLAFIPYIGPIIASIPAILIALTVSPWKALYVVILYIVVHAVEGYFATPLIEQKTVSLPPAMTVIVQILLALLIGFLGLALASPLTVVAVVLINELYVKRQNQAI